MRIHYLVQLQNIVRRYGNRVKIIMYNIQGVTVARDLLLVSVARRGLFRNKAAYTRVCRNYPLYRVGCFRALDFCYLNKFFDVMRSFLQKDLLSALIFVYFRNKPQHLGVPFHITQSRIIEFSHKRHLDSLKSYHILRVLSSN